MGWPKMPKLKVIDFSTFDRPLQDLAGIMCIIYLIFRYVYLLLRSLWE